MLDILIGVILGGGIWLIGYVQSKLEQRFASNLSKNTSPLADDDKETVHRDGIMLKHEIINQCHYFYHETDNTFVCQGSTLEDAALRFNETIKDFVGCFVHANDKQVYCFVDGRVANVDNNHGID
jgi:hypothetical protein